MTELAQNQHPVNQEALKHLKRLGQEISNSHLYALQLALWAMESQNDRWEPSQRPELEQQVGTLLSWEPMAAMRFLLGRQEEALGAEQLLGQPREAALEILNAIHNRMIELVPSYRPAASDRA